MIEGNWKTREVTILGEPLDPAPSQKVYNHSPDGFNWGYSGSGPAQLALAILLYFTRGDAQLSVRYHQDFKFDKIAGLPQDDFRMSVEEVQDWISEHIYGEEEAWGHS